MLFVERQRQSKETQRAMSNSKILAFLDKNWPKKNGKKYQSTPLKGMVFHRLVQKH